MEIATTAIKCMETKIHIIHALNEYLKDVKWQLCNEIFDFIETILTISTMCNTYYVHTYYMSHEPMIASYVSKPQMIARFFLFFYLHVLSFSLCVFLFIRFVVVHKTALWVVPRNHKVNDDDQNKYYVLVYFFFSSKHIHRVNHLRFKRNQE